MEQMNKLGQPTTLCNDYISSWGRGSRVGIESCGLRPLKVNDPWNDDGTERMIKYLKKNESYEN